MWRIETMAAQKKFAIAEFCFGWNTFGSDELKLTNNINGWFQILKA